MCCKCYNNGMKQQDNYEDVQPVIYTIGHSNRSYDEFQELLFNAGIQTVIDCRSRPRSRFAQFNQNRLQSNLADSDIYYEFKGNNLGGLNINVDQDETIDDLSERVKLGECIVLMCSEGKPAACHRGTVLAPLFESRGLLVCHLLYKGMA